MVGPRGVVNVPTLGNTWTLRMSAAHDDVSDGRGENAELTENEGNVRKWSRWSSVYDRVVQRNPLFEGPRKREFELAGIQPGARVVVIGVGTGLDIDHLPRDTEVTGIDVTAAMLERAQAKSEHRNCSLHQMGAEHLEFEADSFDVIIMNCVLSIV